VRAVGAALVAALVAAGSGRETQAHELRPVLLSINETAAEQYEVELRMPVEIALQEETAPVVIFPPNVERMDGGTRARVGETAVERFRVRVPGGLPGQRLGVRFSGGEGSEVLVRVATRDGRVRAGRLIPDARNLGPEWLVPAVPSARVVGETYLRLGVEHILTGLDHLAFVLGLILLTPVWRTLWKTVTAFSAAHSLTLALAALGIVRVPPPPVEATIALSILFVARQACQPQHPHPLPRPPWPMALAFGLLHGLGFAGALSQVGLPEADIPLALFAFNLGVELGQLAFVVLVLLGWRAISRLRWLSAPHRTWLRLVPAYIIGTLAAFWCTDRIAQFWI
jgi:hydrogenase/urease accessory protein HupE